MTKFDIQATGGNAENTSQQADVGRWLNGVRVLCVGPSIVLDVASGALRTFGAEVEQVSPGSWDKVSPASDYDIILLDRIASTTPVGHASDRSASSYLDFVSSENAAVWVTASAFGLQTERRNAVGSDLTVLASGGILGHSHSAEAASPTIPAGQIGLKLVGAVMATAALHGLHVFKAEGAPVHIDLSAQAAIISTGLCLETAHALGKCPDQGGSSRYGAPTGFFECRDGRFYIVVLEQHQWEALCNTLAPALDTISSIEEARDRRDEVNEAVAAWAASRSNVDCERLLQGAGVPCTTVNSVDAFLNRSKEVGRPFDPMPRQFSLPAATTQTPTGPGNHGERGIPLSKLKILDAGHVLAAPLGAAWLGAMGAHVTKFEDPKRYDVYRRRGPFIAGEKSLNKGAYFNQVNFCKRSLETDEAEPDIRPFDVVLHNLTPRRAKKLGVDAQSVLSNPGAKLAICSSGFGSAGPWSEYRAYGHNIHAFSGLVSATRDCDGRMDDVGTPWADPLTGAIIASWVLAWSFGAEQGVGTGVDLSMSELMAAQLVDLLEVDPEEIYAPSAVGGDFFIQSGIDAGLVAVSLTTQQDVDAFDYLTGCRFPGQLPRGSMLTSSELGKLNTLNADDLASALTKNGLAAAKVQSATDVARDPFVRSTALFQSVESASYFSYEVTGLPWVFVGRPRLAITAAPEVDHDHT